MRTGPAAGRAPGGDGAGGPGAAAGGSAGGGGDRSYPSPSDLTDSSSFQRAKFWVNELQNCEEVTAGLGVRGGCGASPEGNGSRWWGWACGHIPSAPLPAPGLPDLPVWHQERPAGGGQEEARGRLPRRAGLCRWYVRALRGTRMLGLGSAGPSRAPAAPGRWGAWGIWSCSIHVCLGSTRGSASALDPQPGSLHAEARALPGTCLGTACPDTGRHVASWDEGTARSLPWAPASSPSPAVPQGGLRGEPSLWGCALPPVPTPALVAEIKAELFETSSKTGQSVGE